MYYGQYPPRSSLDPAVSPPSPLCSVPRLTPHTDALAASTQVKQKYLKPNSFPCVKIESARPHPAGLLSRRIASKCVSKWESPSPSPADQWTNRLAVSPNQAACIG
jgi:hypothetical protein